MSWNEDTRSRVVERSIDGYWHLTRLFFVRGPAREGILSNLASIFKYDTPADIPPGQSNEHLPTIGERQSGGSGFPPSDAFGLDDGVFVFAYNAVLIPTDVPAHTYVEFRYTNDPRLIATKTEDQLTFQSADMSLPIGMKAVRPTLVGPPAFIYTIKTMPFPFTVGRLYQVVLLKNDQLPQCRLAVFDQTNKLHALPIDLSDESEQMLVFRFEGADMTRYSPSYHMVRYAWQFDGGHKDIKLASAAGAQQTVEINIAVPPKTMTFFPSTDPPPTGVNIAGTWVRPPYYTLDAFIAAGEGLATAPTWFGTRTNEYSGGSWSVLPGVSFD